MIEDSMKLSLMPCYAGLQKAEILPFTTDIHDHEGMYLQFVEGCGYTVYDLTPDEAEKLASMLIAGAKEARKNFTK